MALILALCSGSAEARWSSRTLKVIQAFDNPFPDPYAQSVWQSVQSNSRPSFASLEEVDVPVQGLGAGKLPVMMRLQKNSDGSLARAPLLVWIPGIFSTRQDSRAKMLADSLWRLGYHVAMMSNAFSSDYVQMRPERMPGDVPFETGLFKSAIVGIKQYLAGKSALGKTYLVGESYGAFVTMMLLGSLSAEERSLVDGPVTLFSPILNFETTAATVDSNLDEIDPMLSHLDYLAVARATWEFYRARTQADLSPSAIQLAKPLFYSGFSFSLNQVVRSIESVFHVGAMPHFSGPREDLDWSLKLRFRSYLDLYNPSVPKLFFGGETVSLQNWYRKTKAHAYPFELRILAARDDILNSRDIQEWGEFGDDVALLETGGHSGYFQTPWFQRFLAAAFGSDELR